MQIRDTADDRDAVAYSARVSAGWASTINTAPD
jgi:hypothetical protein